MAKPEEKSYIRKEAAKGAGKWFLGSTLGLGVGLGAAGVALYFTGYLAMIAAVSVVGLPLLPVIGGAAGVIVLAATMIGLFKNRASAKAAVKKAGGVPKVEAKVKKHVARPKTKAFLWFLGASVLLGAGAAAMYFTGALAIVAASAVFGVPALPLLAAGAGLFALTAGVIGYFSNRARKAKVKVAKQEGAKEEVELPVKKSAKKGWRKGLAIAAGVTLPLLAIGGAVAAGVFYTGSFAALGATLTAFLMPVVPMLPMIGIGVAAVAAVALITVAAVAITRRVKANKAKKLAAKQAILEGNVDAAVQAVVDTIKALPTLDALVAFQAGWTTQPLAERFHSATSAAGYDDAKIQALIDSKIFPAHQARVIELQNVALNEQGAALNEQGAALAGRDQKIVLLDATARQAREAAEFAKQQAAKAAAETDAVRKAGHDALKPYADYSFRQINQQIAGLQTIEAVDEFEAAWAQGVVQGQADMDAVFKKMNALGTYNYTNAHQYEKTFKPALDAKRAALRPVQAHEHEEDLLDFAAPPVVNTRGALGALPPQQQPAANDAEADAEAQLRAAGRPQLPKK